MSISKPFRFKILDIYLGIICVFPITTTLIDGTLANKLLFVILFAAHLLSFLNGPLKAKTILLLFWLAVHYMFAVYCTEFPLWNSNLLFYFPFFLMYMCFMCDNMDSVMCWLCEKKRYLHTVVNIWTVLTGSSIFFPSCYYVKEGGSLYFGSWCNDIFRLGPSAMFIQILVIFLFSTDKRKSWLSYMIVPLYCVLMGSSRTYVVVGVCLFVVFWYIYCGNKKVFWGTVIPLGAIFVALIMASSIGDKILYTLDENGYGDFWFRVTSSRSELWEKDLTAWSKMPFLNKVLGCGLGFTNDVSGRWGHNDFVEIVCSFGMIGVILYLISVDSIHKKAWNQLRVPLPVKACAILVWFFNACFNMHYVYFCAMLSYPFLIFALRICFVKDAAGMRIVEKTQ